MKHARISASAAWLHLGVLTFTVLMSGSSALGTVEANSARQSLLSPSAELAQAPVPAVTADDPVLVALAKPAVATLKPKSKALKKLASLSPPPSKLMSALQVRRLFLGKTWLWPDGAGYFADDSKFAAWSGAGDKAVYGEGRWTVSAFGTLCMRATWYTKKAHGPNVTCFSHRIEGDTVFQKKLPSGTWYAFRNAPATPADEFAKLKDGDLVVQKVDEIKDAFKARKQ